MGRNQSKDTGTLREKRKVPYRDKIKGTWATSPPKKIIGSQGRKEEEQFERIYKTQWV